MSGPAWALCAVCLVLLVAGGLAGALPPAPFAAPAATAAPAGICPDPEERAFVGLVNAFRAARGLRPLAASADLAAAADRASHDLAVAGGPDPGGAAAAPLDALRVSGAPGAARGLNTDWGPEAGAAATVFDWWRHSPKHRRNLLGEQYRSVGFARAQSADPPYAWYWTAAFASTPATPPDC